MLALQVNLPGAEGLECDSATQTFGDSLPKVFWLSDDVSINGNSTIQLIVKIMYHFFSGRKITV